MLGINRGGYFACSPQRGFQKACVNDFFCSSGSLPLGASELREVGDARVHSELPAKPHLDRTTQIEVSR